MQYVRRDGVTLSGAAARGDSGGTRRVTPTRETEPVRRGWPLAARRGAGSPPGRPPDETPAPLEGASLGRTSAADHGGERGACLQLTDCGACHFMLLVLDQHCDSKHKPAIQHKHHLDKARAQI